MDDQAPTIPEYRQENGIEQRGAKRYTTLKKGNIIFNNAMCNVECLIRDLSKSGARVELPLWHDLPKRFMLAIAGGPSRQCEVVWSVGNWLGVNFTDQTAALHQPTMNQASCREDLLTRVGRMQQKLSDLHVGMNSLRADLASLKDEIESKV